MTVAELIAKLQAFPHDALVAYETENGSRFVGDVVQDSDGDIEINGGTWSSPPSPPEPVELPFEIRAAERPK